MVDRKSTGTALHVNLNAKNNSILFFCVGCTSSYFQDNIKSTTDYKVPEVQSENLWNMQLNTEVVFLLLFCAFKHFTDNILWTTMQMAQLVTSLNSEVPMFSSTHNSGFSTKCIARAQNCHLFLGRLLAKEVTDILPAGHKKRLAKIVHHEGSHH